MKSKALCAAGIAFPRSWLAGTTVATSRVVMRLSETIIIYLACGAPFGVSCFLHYRIRERRAHTFFRAIASGLLWPLTAFRILFADAVQNTSIEAADELSQQSAKDLHQAKRIFLDELHALKALAEGTDRSTDDELGRIECVLRESVEAYVGLAPTGNNIVSKSTPNDSSSELFQIAGHDRDDLVIATRCVHRRNAARLRDHHSRARTHLMQSLTEIRSIVNRERSPANANVRADIRLNLAAVKLYTAGFQLSKLIEDDEAAIEIAGFLNQELSRVRRIQLIESHSSLVNENGEELCTELMYRPSHASLTRETETRG